MSSAMLVLCVWAAKRVALEIEVKKRITEKTKRGKEGCKNVTPVE
jgi:hypothetical protein